MKKYYRDKKRQYNASAKLYLEIARENEKEVIKILAFIESLKQGKISESLQKKQRLLLGLLNDFETIQGDTIFKYFEIVYLVDNKRITDTVTVSNDSVSLEIINAADFVKVLYQKELKGRQEVKEAQQDSTRINLKKSLNV